MAPKPLTVKEYLDGLPIAGLLALLVVIGSRLADLLVDIGSALQMCSERVAYLCGVLKDFEKLSSSKKRKRDWAEDENGFVVILDEGPNPESPDNLIVVETAGKKLNEVMNRMVKIEKISREIRDLLRAINRLHDAYYA